MDEKRRKPSKYNKYRKGGDYEILREKAYERKVNKRPPICDYHEDGA